MVPLFQSSFFILYIFVFFFESVWWSRLSWVACQSIYICSREDCDIENPIFPLDVKNKNDRVSSPPIIRLYIFAAIFLCLLFVISFLFFFQSPAINLWFAYPCSIICLFVLQKSFHVSRNHITIFLYFFLIIPPQFNPQTHKKIFRNSWNCSSLSSSSISLSYIHDFVLHPFFVTPSCHPFFLTGPFEDPQISKEKRIANAYSRKRKTLAFKIHL